MTDKTLYTLRLGGNDVTLKFRMGAWKRAAKLLGKDPMQYAGGSMSEAEAMEMAEKLVIAGMLNQNPDADVSRVSQDFDDLMPKDAGDIIRAFFMAYSADKPEDKEDKPDTQEKAA